MVVSSVAGVSGAGVSGAGVSGAGVPGAAVSGAVVSGAGVSAISGAGVSVANISGTGVSVCSGFSVTSVWFTDSRGVEVTGGSGSSVTISSESLLPSPSDVPSVVTMVAVSSFSEERVVNDMMPWCLKANRT